MTTIEQVSIETYLSTIYEPDVDYVDGRLEDRNVGEYDHSTVQQTIFLWFHQHAREWKIRCVVEQRTRVAVTKYRVPDVSVFSRSTQVEQIFTSPQLIALEVLSPEDRHSRLDRKIQNYIDFGVPHIWVVDPVTRKGWDCSAGGWASGERFEVKDSPIYLALSELFETIDADNAD